MTNHAEEAAYDLIAAIVLRALERPAAPPVAEGPPRASPGRPRVEPLLRRTVRLRDEDTCVYCCETGTAGHGPDGKSWHIDHVVPVSAGGTDDLDNLVLSCARCNLKKSNRSDVVPGSFQRRRV